MKERIESFDFIRAICAWIIVVYHFADICITTPQFTNFPFFYTYANGRWGETTVVTIFFCSPALLFTIIIRSSICATRRNFSGRGLKAFSRCFICCGCFYTTNRFAA